MLVRWQTLRSEKAACLRGIHSAQSLRLLGCEIYPCFAKRFARALEDRERELDSVILQDCDFMEDALPVLTQALSRLSSHPLRSLTLRGVKRVELSARDLLGLFRSARSLLLGTCSVTATALIELKALCAHGASDPGEQALQRLHLDDLTLVNNLRRGDEALASSEQETPTTHDQPSEEGMEEGEAGLMHPLRGSPRDVAGLLGEALLVAVPQLLRINTTFVKFGAPETTRGDSFMACLAQLPVLEAIDIQYCDLPPSAAAAFFDNHPNRSRAATLTRPTQQEGQRQQQRQQEHGAQSFSTTRAHSPSRLKALKIQLRFLDAALIESFIRWLKEEHARLKTIHIAVPVSHVRLLDLPSSMKMYQAVLRAAVDTCRQLGSFRFGCRDAGPFNDAIQALLGASTVARGRRAAARVAATHRLTSADAEAIAEYLPVCTRTGEFDFASDPWLNPLPHLLKGMPEWPVLVALGAGSHIPQRIADGLLAPEACPAPWVWQQLRSVNRAAAHAAEAGRGGARHRAGAGDDAHGGGSHEEAPGTSRHTQSSYECVPSLQELCCVALRCQVIRSETDLLDALPRLPFLSLRALRTTFFLGVDIEPMLDREEHGNTEHDSDTDDDSGGDGGSDGAAHSGRARDDDGDESEGEGGVFEF